MVEIRYMKSEAGFDNCFDLLFPINDYTAGIEDEFDSKDMRSEYKYYTWLFKKNDLFLGSDKGKAYIWTIHWDCEIEGIPFTMVYDEDYDLISFSVSKENIRCRERVAESVKRLVEKEANI